MFMLYQMYVLQLETVYNAYSCIVLYAHCILISLVGLIGTVILSCVSRLV